MATSSLCGSGLSRCVPIGSSPYPTPQETLSSKRVHPIYGRGLVQTISEEESLVVGILFGASAAFVGHRFGLRGESHVETCRLVPLLLAVLVNQYCRQSVPGTNIRTIRDVLPCSPGGPHLHDDSGSDEVHYGERQRVARPYTNRIYRCAARYLSACASVFIAEEDQSRVRVGPTMDAKHRRLVHPPCTV